MESQGPIAKNSVRPIVLGEGVHLGIQSWGPTGLIQHHGDWLSECYKRYLAFDFHEKLSVSGRMAAKIMEGDSFEPCSLPSEGQHVKLNP